MIDNKVYAEAGRLFKIRNKDTLTNSECHHKCWSTLKSAVFGSSSSLAPLIGGGSGLVCESVEKAICCLII